MKHIKTIITGLIILNSLFSILNSTAQPAHVIITAGQSSTDGRISNKLLHDYIKSMATDTVDLAEGAYKHCKISQNRNDGKFVPYFPKNRSAKNIWMYDDVTYYLLNSLLREDFYLVEYAVGGTSIQYPNDTAKGCFWSANPDWLAKTASFEKGGNSLLLSFTDGIDAAIDNTLSKLENGYQIDAFLWHQGESDDRYVGRDYENLKTVIAYVGNHLTLKTDKDYSKLPFVFGSIPTSNRHFKTEIDAAMRRIAAEDANAYLVDMSEGELQRDRTHFNEKSAIEMQKPPKPPIMGWSSWNNFRVNINEKMIREQADVMRSSVLYEAGYRFINIDDGYFGGRDANGTLYCDSAKFPSGMRSLAGYIHSKGLKAGIYTDAGANTCGSIYDKDEKGIGVGIYGHIEQDCRTFFTDWGYDFLKVDWCGGERQKLDEQTEYTQIISAVRATNPDIVFNVCRWQFPGEWVTNQADSWRISSDIRSEFRSILEIIDLNTELHKYASSGHYNDMDMLQVGRGMTYEEDKTHFSMWCMLVSPLLAGNDLRNMSKETLEILTNKEIIAINQDKLFRQAQKIHSENGVDIWEKPLADGSKAIALLNRENKVQEFALVSKQFNINGKSKIRDLWQHKDLGKMGKERTFTIEKHGIIVLKIKE
ncbi:MAG: alpha-galactosidase [Bacteroidales bacterium]|jgi:hypothetical protein|nr:alpha-galactosidase [Bacteroidales bacterium]